MTLDSYQPHHMPQPPPESSFRGQNPRLGRSISGESHTKGQSNKLAKDARRRRVELRRIRSFSQSVSVADPPDSDSSPVDVDYLVDMQNGGVSRLSHCKISVVGRRREMEDAVAVELGFLKRSGGESYDFFGVFEGREGRRVARARSQMLHLMLAEIVEAESEKEIEWEKVMREGFHEVEAKIHDNGALVGSAAVVGDNEVVVAGSKAVLCRGGAAVRLLEAKDGEIESESESKSEREVQVRVEMTRCEDEFLILGSGGFWEVISDEVACQVAGRYGGGAEAAAALMAELAVAQGSKHNVSVIVVDLRSGAGAAAAADHEHGIGTPTSSSVRN